MATTDELRAAAERLRRLFHEDEQSPLNEILPESMAEGIRNDVLRLAAEHPADDGESPDAAWLTGGGVWVEIDHGWYLTTVEQGVDYGPDGPEPWHLSLVICPHNGEMRFDTDREEDVLIPVKLTTRGHVRRLCAALGAPLKGQT